MGRSGKLTKRFKPKGKKDEQPTGETEEDVLKMIKKKPAKAPAKPPVQKKKYVTEGRVDYVDLLNSKNPRRLIENIGKK
ncbi:hypothetical protein HDU96_009157 [Phlyctochytrium bullatum]|nr:hypothetical protein HDU96_009157 [Phlyctochytrium bullatum]